MVTCEMQSTASRASARAYLALVFVVIATAVVMACGSQSQEPEEESVSSISRFEYNCSVIYAVEIDSFDEYKHVAETGNINEASVSFSNGIVGWGWGGNPPNCSGGGPNNSTSASNWRLHEWLKNEDFLAGPYKSGLKNLYIAEIDQNLVTTIQSTDLPLGFDQRVVERIRDWDDASSWTVVYFGYEG